jgi:hypothetical protein
MPNRLKVVVPDGHRGAELKTPGWVDMVIGPEPFPVREMHALS